MNIFDYFFSYSKDLKKDFILGPAEQISYNQVFEKGLKLANYLNREIGENQNIILISQNSVFFLIAYLGIIKSGNVCVPLNPVIEQDNLDFIMDTTKSQYVFAPKRISVKYSFAEAKIIEEINLNEILDFDTKEEGNLNDNFDLTA